MIRQKHTHRRNGQANKEKEIKAQTKFKSRISKLVSQSVVDELCKSNRNTSTHVENLLNVHQRSTETKTRTAICHDFVSKLEKRSTDLDEPLT